MNSSQYEKGINIFYEIMNEQPDYRKNVYLLTAIAYKKLNKLDSAATIVILSWFSYREA
jgi:lipopolysaccharide biosynthesis regulator YciM